MHNITRKKPQHLFWIWAIALIFICTACTSAGTPSNVQQNASTMSTASATASAHPVSTIALPSGPITYVALGASDAVGVGSTQPGSQGYVPLLAARLPKGSHLIDLGVSGIHLHEALTEELPIALTAAPNLITIWLVANDFVAGVSYNDYIHDLDSLLKQLRARTHARLVMANLPDLTHLPAFEQQTAPQKARMLQAIQHWNTGIAAIAAQYGSILVDLFAQQSQLTAHPEYVSGDGFHPSAAGYAQLANFFWKAING